MKYLIVSLLVLAAPSAAWMWWETYKAWKDFAGQIVAIVEARNKHLSN